MSGLFDRIVDDHRASMAVIGERVRAIDDTCVAVGGDSAAHEPSLPWDGRILRPVSECVQDTAPRESTEPDQRRTNWLT